MAERRMFAKSIVLSDAFLDMPLSARCLYFTLGMLADDDGFVGNPKSIMRQCGASQDDMAVLLQKRFVLGFESGVIVIKHWRMNNYLQNDRHKSTTYLEELSTLDIDDKGAYTELNKEARINSDVFIPIEEKPEMSDARKKRAQAKKDSSLPSTFDSRIRNAFVGHHCPICGVIMSYNNNLVKPTIQHNLPISCGGKHELDNISVICQSCNTSIQNKVETPPYNTEEVKAVWECIGNVYTGKDSIDKNSIDKVSIDKVSIDNNIVEIVDYLNLVCQSKYNPKTKNTIKHINARLSEGYTVDDFKTVIDKKYDEWKGTQMEQYLRPDTLFGTKFESYLNQKINKEKGKSKSNFFNDLWSC